MIAAILEDLNVNQCNSWLQGIYHAMRWMKDQVGEEHVPDELLQLDTLQAWHGLQPAAVDLKKLIKKAETSHLDKVASFCDLQKHGRLHYQLLKEMGWTLDTDDADAEVRGDEVTFCCDECDKTFTTAASLVVHQQRKHKRRVGHVEDTITLAAWNVATRQRRYRNHKSKGK